MKKTVSIFSLVVATFALVVFAIVPHHHHADGAPCLVIAHCTTNHNDSCTEGHHHQGDQPCSVTASYIISETNHNDIRCKVTTCCSDQYHGFHAPFFIINAYISTITPPSDLRRDCLWNDFQGTTYQSLTALSMGLRGPPAPAFVA